MGFHTIISDFRRKLENSSVNPISIDELEKFYNEINSFVKKQTLFPSYYKKYVENLNRVKPEILDQEMDTTLLAIALAENPFKPTRPKEIFIHLLKYKFPLVSKFYIARQKKHNQKKLNASKVKFHDKTQFKSEEWTKIPICKPDSKCNHN